MTGDPSQYIASHDLSIGPEPSAAETFGAGFSSESIETDRWQLFSRTRDRYYTQIADKLGIKDWQGYKNDPLSNGWATQKLLAANPWDDQLANQRADLLAKAQEAAQYDPQAFKGVALTPNEIDQAVAQQLLTEWLDSQNVFDRGDPGIVRAASEFLGRMSAAATDEVNLPLMAAGVGEGASLARVMGTEAALGVAGEAATLPAQYRQASRLGLPEPDPLTQLGTAALGSAAFGALLHGLGRGVKWIGTPEARAAREKAITDLLGRASELSPAQRGALDRLRSEKSAVETTPTTNANDHLDASEKADIAIQEDQPDIARGVDAPDKARDLITPPSAEKIESFVTKARGAESGGKATAKNPRSTATGPLQFTEDTWLRVVKKNRPDLAGLPRAQLLALREDQGLSFEMGVRLAEENAAGLQAAGFVADDKNLYLAHFAGLAGAKRVLKADPNTPVSKLFPRDKNANGISDVIEANPFLKGKTAADMIRWADAKMTGAGDAPAFKPRSRVTLAASSIKSDPKRFQFRSNVNEAGVTGALDRVTEWNDELAGDVMVWTDLNGERWIVDGHHRLDLANRLEANGHAPIELWGFELHEADGITAAEARTRAAIRNIENGSGSAVDAAKVLGNNPDLFNRLSLSKANQRDAQGLVRLGDEAFGMVVNDVIPENYGAIIGRISSDPAEQAAIARVLARVNPRNAIEAESIARDAKRAGMEKKAEGAQTSLFDDANFDLVDSLFEDRAKVLSGTLRKLKRDRAVFDTLVRENGKIGEAGNVLATDTNAARARNDALAISILGKLVNRAGPVDDALTAAARTARASTGDNGVREFSDFIRGAIESGDIGRYLNESDGAGRNGAETPDALPEQPGGDGLTDLGRHGATEQDPAPEVKPSEPSGDLFNDPVNGASAETQSAELGDELDRAISAERSADLSMAEIWRRGEDLVQNDSMPPERLFPKPPKRVLAAKNAGEFIDPAEAGRRVADWKAEAARMGREEDHSNKVIISLFDYTGKWSQPWRDAGFTVIQYDARFYDDAGDFASLRDFDLMENFPISDIQQLRGAGAEIYGVMSATPCTTFAASGARWWKGRHDAPDPAMVEKLFGPIASRYFDTPNEVGKTLVEVTRAIVEIANPSAFHVIENPIGRIAKETDLPDARLVFDPHNFGDAYTKKTNLFGEFNENLPYANVDPVEGSKVHKLRGDKPEDKAARSDTPEGFAYAFFMANKPKDRGGAPVNPAAIPDQAGIGQMLTQGLDQRLLGGDNIAADEAIFLAVDEALGTPEGQGVIRDALGVLGIDNPEQVMQDAQDVVAAIAGREQQFREALPPAMREDIASMTTPGEVWQGDTFDMTSAGEIVTVHYTDNGPWDFETRWPTADKTQIERLRADGRDTPATPEDAIVTLDSMMGDAVGIEVERRFWEDQIARLAAGEKPGWKVKKGDDPAAIARREAARARQSLADMQSEMANMWSDRAVSAFRHVAEQRADLEAPRPKTSEATPAGEQTVIPGAEKISDRQLAERRQSQPLRGTSEAPPEGGLFDELARNQQDLFDELPKGDFDVPTDEGTARASEILADLKDDEDFLGALDLCKPK